MLFLLCSAVIAFITLFDINDYSVWITRQVEKQTGYHLSFEEITIDGWLNPQLTISGVAIAYQAQPLLKVERLLIKSHQWDLWHRHLNIAAVELQGGSIWIDDRQLSAVNKVPPKQPREPTSQYDSLLPWRSLTIDKVALTDVNAQIHYQDTDLQLQQLDLSSENLTLISNNQFVYLARQGNWQVALKEAKLQLQSDRSVRLNDLSLQSNFNLVTLQAQLMLAIQQISVSSPEFSDVIDNAMLELQLDNNKLVLQRLFARAFTGELQLQGEATFVFNPLSDAFITVQNVTLLSLVMKDMKLYIPQLLTHSKSTTSSKEKTALPITSLFIKHANLENIDISSTDAAIPLQLEKGSVLINDLQLVEHNQLVDLWSGSKQKGNISIKFAYLQWQDTIIEALQTKL